MPFGSQHEGLAKGKPSLCRAIVQEGAPGCTARASTEPRPAAHADVRWQQLAALIEEMDPHHVVRGWALFDGAFGQTSGEVGPTGKPRSWRVHELRSERLWLQAAPSL
jgi:hypothetical protein